MESANFDDRLDYFVIDNDDSLREKELTVVFAIKQLNTELLSDLLLKISDPNNDDVNKYLSREEVADLTANPEATKRIQTYLKKNGLQVLSTTLYGEYITASGTISLWEEIFSTKFYTFQHFEDKEDRIIRSRKYHLHHSIASDISTVFNVIDLPFPRSLRKQQEQSKEDPIVLASSSSIYQGYIYPSMLKSYYRIPSSGGNNKASQCIYASIGQSFSPADLSNFQSTFGTGAAVVFNVTGGHMNDTACLVNYDNCNEANLDIQYIMAVAPNVPTTFW